MIKPLRSRVREKRVSQAPDAPRGGPLMPPDTSRGVPWCPPDAPRGAPWRPLTPPGGVPWFPPGGAPWRPLTPPGGSPDAPWCPPAVSHDAPWCPPGGPLMPPDAPWRQTLWHTWCSLGSLQRSSMGPGVGVTVVKRGRGNNVSSELLERKTLEKVNGSIQLLDG